MRKILLMSGGLDSTCLYFENKEWISDILYFDYGHKFKDAELKVMDALKINYKVEQIQNLSKNETGFFYCRNLTFMMKVRELYPNEDILVYFGNNADDNYCDNSREYFYRLEALINDSHPKTLRIICPYENLTKEQIYRKYKDLNIEIDPYWCDSGESIPCRKCHSCQAMISAKLL